METCRDCGGAMVQGFCADKGHGQSDVGYWYPGAAVRNLFYPMFGIRKPRSGLPVSAFRCEQCGHLEFYAGEEFKPE